MREPDGAGGLNDLSIALIGILGPAIFAYVVYVYRPQIGFQTQCAKANIRAEDRKIVHSNLSDGVQIEVGKITLVNGTRADVDEFEIAFELRDPEVKFMILETKHIAKSSIEFSKNADEISISIRRFPAKEKIVIGYSSIGNWGLEYVRPKKKAGKFNLYSIKSREDFFKFVFIGVFFSIFLASIPTLVLMLTRKFSEGQ